MIAALNGPDDPVLAVPHDLVLPDAARARLQRQFERLRPVVGVVAPIHFLAPGSSVTTAAERAAMAPMDICAKTADVEVQGAVLLAAGVGHVIDARSVRLEGHAETDEANRAVLLVDPGAASFDPGATATAPAPPADDARPPFRWRPLVLFLAGTPDPRVAARAADLADALVELDVEPRLAVHRPLDGPLRIGPLLPEPSVIAALRPDLVIALDAEAVEVAEHAEGSSRSMVVALLDEDLGDRIELVPWTLGSAQGRLRARLGDRADARAVAALVNRLCSGPMPEPPREGPDLAVAPPSVPGPTPTTATSNPVAVELGRPRILHVFDGAAPDADPRPQPLLAGLVDHLLAAGWVLASPPEPAGAGGEADLVLVTATRSDVHPSIHVVEDIDAATALAADASSRPQQRRRAIAPSARAAAPLRAAGVDTIVVPALPTRSAVIALDQAFERRIRPAVPTIALLVGDRAGAVPDRLVVDAIGRALEQMDASYGELELVVVGEANLDEPLASRGVVRPGPADLVDPGRLVGWSMAVRLDGRPGPSAGADPHPSVPDDIIQSLTTLALAGVPVIMPTEDARGLGALADRSIAVARPTSADDWVRAIEQLLDDGSQATASQRARRIGLSIAGTEAAALVVERVLGWWAEDQR